MDKVYKLKDVPKGQRIRYYFDYLFLPTLGIIAAVALLVILTIHFLTPEKYDFYVILANNSSDNYTTDGTYAKLNQALANRIGDSDADGEVNHILIYTNIDEGTMNADPEYLRANVDKYYSEVTSGSAVILIGDEAMFQRSFIGEDLAAKNDELGTAHLSADEKYVKIPLSKTILSDIEHADELFVTIRSKDSVEAGQVDEDHYNVNLKSFYKIIGR